MWSRPNEPTELPEDQRDTLDRMLARLTTQRACLDFAATYIAGLVGPVVELGLGKGRTYDRIRRIMPDREILAFDRNIHCPQNLMPPSEKLFLGDFRDTLRAAQSRFGATVAMIHADIGSDDRNHDAKLVRDIGPLIDSLVRRNGTVLSDREIPLSSERWTRLSLPPDAARTGWPYYVWARQL